MAQVTLTQRGTYPYMVIGVLRDECIPLKTQNVPCLIDTGAGYCYMPFSRWKYLGFAKTMLQQKAELFHKIGVSQVNLEQLQFKDVPCAFQSTRMGDGSLVSSFEFKLDYLEFGTLGSGVLSYPDVTIRVIESTQNFFIVGANILHPSSFSWNPDISEKTNGSFKLQFGEENMSLYRSYNNLQSKFLFLSDENTDLELQQASTNKLCVDPMDYF